MGDPQTSRSFDSEEPTQPIPYITLEDTARMWRAQLAQSSPVRDDDAQTTRMAVVR